tara:strand:+ start:1938 stop:2861 length:924 start_codon:yes stop_codon:yes gene_type:complete
MGLLSDKQKAYLKKQNISLGSVFDAKGLGQKEYKTVMKELGKTVATGVTPCKREKHTMRTRSGHCIECNSASIAFQNRHSMDAYVYVAGSLNLSVIKVGLSSNTEARMLSLNSLNYAGTSDWKCLYWVNTKNAGTAEFKTHKALEEFAAPKVYRRNEQNVDCLETFSCSAAIAIKEVNNQTDVIIDEWQDNALLKQYEFLTKRGEAFVRKKGANLDGSSTPLHRSKRKQKNPKLPEEIIKPTTKEVTKKTPLIVEGENLNEPAEIRKAVNNQDATDSQKNIAVSSNFYLGLVIISAITLLILRLLYR